ncbi:MoeZ/MoeB [Lentisphaera araneosa HTCC2155]|uniref:MoeZ/MoeB n=1 Tax=Lentisphaera araneosa HTCC2155 TaxID=313628 RepID=A6DJQ5_9BACT|nr:HesA/MoeB/ThiF family protein [Lentisphaera araneosa]EDM28129.1 MoeZ/MoeB [Lentisphaera araneosa HTCC2155]
MKPLNQEEKDTYAWQTTVPGFGEEGQVKLKNSTVFISRCGGLGSVVAYELAAAGIGKMILAHGGNVKHSDLNRQLLMTHDWLGKPRIESVERRLKELNPRLEIEAVNSNVNEENAQELMKEADLIIDCAPLFEERYLMNREAIRNNIPLVECAMFEMQAQITTIIPGKTACLTCIYPEKPAAWKRRFPVFGAVSGTVGCMAAMEAVKVLSNLGDTLENKLLSFDLRDMTFMKSPLIKRDDCPACSGHSS